MFRFFNGVIVRTLKKILCLLAPFALGACDFDEADNRVCFIGDSITYQWDLEYFFPQYVPLKHAVNGARIRDLDNWNLDECRGITSVILMGTNNSKEFYDDLDREIFLKDFFTRIERIQADPLIVVSILPKNYQREQDETINKAIFKVNTEIKKGLDSLVGHYDYLDVFHLFVNDDYNAKMDLFKDGLHPNIAGQEILSSEVLKRLR